VQHWFSSDLACVCLYFVMHVNCGHQESCLGSEAELLLHHEGRLVVIHIQADKGERDALLVV
jgi:hypothetical protein